VQIQSVSENIIILIVEEGTPCLEDAVENAAAVVEEAEGARSKDTLADHYYKEECSVEDHAAMIQEEEEEEVAAANTVGRPDFVRLRRLRRLHHLHHLHPQVHRQNLHLSNQHSRQRHTEMNCRRLASGLCVQILLVANSH
jgi:hypothetical protein